MSDFELELENLVDQAGLYNVLETLGTVCALKAGHLRSDWQDEGAARAWERAGARIAATLKTKAIAGL